MAGACVLVQETLLSNNGIARDKVRDATISEGLLVLMADHDMTYFFDFEQVLAMVSRDPYDSEVCGLKFTLLVCLSVRLFSRCVCMYR